MRAYGWLLGWAGALEGSGCLSPGQELPAARLVAQALPSGKGRVYNLLDSPTRTSGRSDLLPWTKLRVTTPIFREGAPDDAKAAAETTRTQTSRQQLKFAADARHFRMLVLTRISHRDHNTAFLAGPTLAELEERTTAVERDPVRCEEISWCVAIDTRAALLPFVRTSQGSSRRRREGWLR